MFAMFFAAELTSRKRIGCAIALVVASLFLALNGIFPSQKIFIDGIGFWIPSGESFYPYIASTALSLLFNMSSKVIFRFLSPHISMPSRRVPELLYLGPHAVNTVSR
jgi:hypothetical protein